MALYSVWNWDTNSYRIYTTPATVSVGDDPVPPRPTGLAPLGADPDTGVKPLPRGARFVGYSHIPRGEIRRSGGGGVGDDAGSQAESGWWKFAVGIAAGGVLMWFWRRK